MSDFDKEHRYQDRPIGEYLGLEDPEARKPGMLTYSQREYLYDPSTIADSSQATKRQRIRDRVRNALFDFDYLRAMQPKDRKMILSNIESRERKHDAVRSALSFLWSITQDSEVEFERTLENAIAYADGGIQGRYLVTGVDVNIHVETRLLPDVEEAFEKVERGEQLTDQELGHLIRRVDEGELDKLIEHGRTAQRNLDDGPD